MKGAQRSIITLLNLSLIAAMLSSSFLATRGFFNDPITSKQYGLEIICLSAGLLFVITFAFKNQIIITNIDLLVLVFCAWQILSEVYIFHSPYIQLSETIFNVALWLTVYLFVRSAAQQPAFVWAIGIVWMVVSLLQSGLGLMQLYGFESSYHGLFSITGTFHNPGPFSGFVVSGLPIALSVISYQSTVSSQQLSEKKLGVRSLELGLKYSIQILGWLTLVLILLVLPPAQSRAAWVAGIAGGLFVLSGHPALLSFKNSLKNKFLTIRKPLRVVLLTIVLLSITTAGFGLYSMKKGSADGRMLIWQVTSQLIKQSPVTGHGTGAFNALYMNEQANWFESGKGTEAQAMVAGSPEAPFNEPLKLWLEKGLIAILLAGAILYFIFVTNKPPTYNYKLKTLNTKLSTKNPKLTTCFKGALISLLVFSLFSYPFDISSFVLQLVILVALLAGTSNQMLTITGRKTLFLTIPTAIAIIIGSIHYVPQRQEHYQAMNTWQEANQLYNYRAYPASVAAYEEAFPELQTNGLFLQMYGKALSMDEQYERSNKVLHSAQQRFGSQIIQNTLGDNHKALKNYDEAETAYIISAQMIPSLLLPKYLLAKLYNESGQHQKAQQTAEEVLNSTIKVESSATREIMNEMKKISEQLSVSSMTDN
jgi:O-antigen ligase